MMHKPLLSAAVVAAACWTPGWAVGQGIYKCGETYSQSPCPDGRQVAVDDARTAAQKKQADDATRRDARLAQDMEKERLTQEKKALADRSFQASVRKAPATRPDTSPQTSPITKITPKRLRPGERKSNDFVAQVPGTGKKTAPRKSAKKKKTDSL